MVDLDVLDDENNNVGGYYFGCVLIIERIYGVLESG